MPRLLGVEIPADKRIEASLTYIYGIGLSTAKRILEQTNIDPNLRAKNLTPQQLNEIIHAITNNKIKIEGDLRRDVQGNLKRLQAINSYRGIRHRKGLPVRGQRTSTNARTRKGPRKTVGVIRNPEAKAGKVLRLTRKLWLSQRNQPNRRRKNLKLRSRSQRRLRRLRRKTKRRQLQSRRKLRRRQLQSLRKARRPRLQRLTHKPSLLKNLPSQRKNSQL